MTDVSRADAARIFEQWDLYAKTGKVMQLLALYTDDAVLESPLVPAILDDMDGGVLRGQGEIHRFFSEGVKRRPNHLVRWHRTGEFLTSGRTLIWEYPRETPDGDQVDICEVMEIRDGKIAHHRIYWGWFGTGLLVRNAMGKQGNPASLR